MAAYLTKNNEYYEGKQANIDDIKVPSRLSVYHVYDRNNKIWVLDNQKFSNYKKGIVETLNTIYRVQTDTSSLSNDEKNYVRNKYNALINKVTNAKTMEELQDIVID